MDHEFERFKRDVNLVAFAESHGYQVDKRESSISCLVLRHSDGDKVVAGRSIDGHWQYFSIRDRDDKGTVIDFIQKRKRKSLEEIRKEVREWTHTHDNPRATSREAHPITKDSAAVALAIARALEPPSHPYLEARGLTRDTLSDLRFRGTWKQEDGPYRNVLFPHHDFEGLSGFEVKNTRYTGFSKGGPKGIWQSQCDEGDAKLVVTESAIDAMSYHQLHPDKSTRYMSVGGELSATQPLLIAIAMAFMKGQSATIIGATDRDKAGHEIATRIRTIAMENGFAYQRHAAERGKDWNEQLQTIQRQSSIRLRVPRSQDLGR